MENIIQYSKTSCRLVYIKQDGTFICPVRYILPQQAAKSYFDLIENGYRQGSNTLIEYIDAQNQFTVSSLKLTITTYKVLQAMASIERETATYSFNN